MSDDATPQPNPKPEPPLLMLHSWVPPDGVSLHSISWCHEANAWRVRLQGDRHGETLYVPRGELTAAYLDAVAKRMLSQGEEFGKAGREFERLWGKWKGGETP